VSVLVLGSAGLVGRSLVGRLASAGNSVVACDVRPSPIPPVAGVSYGQTDVSRLDQVLALVEQHEVSGVVLLSYMMGQLMSPKYADILQACQTNITGVTNVLEAAGRSPASRRRSERTSTASASRRAFPPPRPDPREHRPHLGV
jgi:nucleoside-diphosphate-sugar epimerase